MDKKQTWNLGYWVFALLLLFLVQSVWQNANQLELVSYSAFEKALSDGLIAEVTVTDQAMTGRLKTANGHKTTLMATRVEPELASRLNKYEVPYTRARIGEFDVDLFREFFQGLVNHARMTLHLDNLRGANAHHQAESIFKAFGRALRMAVERDPRRPGIASTKGAL